MTRRFALLAPLVLAACASTKAPAPAQLASAPVPAAAATRSSADELLAYTAQVRAMAEPALTAEAAKRKRESGDLARVKAAVALSFSSQSDETEILALVEPVEKRAGDRDVKAMAGFLQAMALERRRVKESTAARLRDEQKALDAQRQRADALQQKLEALSELEKSLSDRPAEH
ncbi:MAG TPA: hypothetical protein VH040_00030 [Usitatibacter sp.]|nr:hypothetical protein [Usitatibacter sp.]